MDKVVRRIALARNQAKRKAIREEKGLRRTSYKEYLKNTFAQRRLELDAIRNERERRREDWLRGPLAPRRDVGAQGLTFGALQPELISPVKLPQHLRRRYVNFAPGDRVCIIRGRDQGRIDEVQSVDVESETVTTGELRKSNVYLPDWFINAYQHKSNIHTLPMPIPIDDVRLVVPLDDPVTGNTKDVVAEHVYGGGPYLEREWGSTTPRHTRYITGLDIEIPWPHSERQPIKDEAPDTLRMEVETPTWTPSLLKAPFPFTVMDELRNKFSKYRTRHDPEWVQAKRMQDLRNEYLASRTLLTPRGELAKLRREQHAEKANASRDADGNVPMPRHTVGFIQGFVRRQSRAGEQKQATETSS